MILTHFKKNLPQLFFEPITSNKRALFKVHKKLLL